MVTCENCGQTWPRDPALEVRCPTCRAAIGQLCKRPSGHGCDVHASRDHLAMAQVAGYGRCPAAFAPPQQFDMFAEALL
jgi:hypothetical protein